MERTDGLEKLRMPFPEHQISKLPKPTKAQTDLVRQDFKNGIRCGVCGGWHHKDVIHLDYVGHAALTDRLLESDPLWSWDFLATDDRGLPVLDENGGMWIKLTVCGVTRLGYGDAQGKSGGDAMKERIGDALRNAAMRFGAALDLWHKGRLHIEEEGAEKTITNNQVREIRELLGKAGLSEDSLCQSAGICEIDKLSSDKFDGYVNYIKSKIKQAA